MNITEYSLFGTTDALVRTVARFASMKLFGSSGKFVPGRQRLYGYVPNASCYMECGGKRSATPLWLRAERAPEPEATVRPPPAPPKAIAPSPLRSAGALHIKKLYDLHDAKPQRLGQPQTPTSPKNQTSSLRISRNRRGGRRFCARTER